MDFTGLFWGKERLAGVPFFDGWRIYEEEAVRTVFPALTTWKSKWAGGGGGKRGKGGKGSFESFRCLK